MRRILLVALVGALALPAGAGARTYTVRSCKDQSAGAVNWARVGSDPSYAFTDECDAKGHGMVVGFSPSSQSAAAGSEADRVFAAPAGTTITRAQITYVLDIFSPNAVGRLDAVRPDGSVQQLAAAPCATTCPNVVTNTQSWDFKDPVNQFVARLFCSPGGGTCTNNDSLTQVQVENATIDLDDPSAPTVDADASKGLWQGGTQPRGQVDVVTAAKDVGSGVQSVRLLIDGTPVAQTDNDCSDGRAAPCGNDFAPTLKADLTGLAQGAHTAQLQATDAAGNASAPADRQVAFTLPAASTTNPSDPNNPFVTLGTINGNATADVKAKLTAGFGKKLQHAMTVGYKTTANATGRLVDQATGKPISGATINVATRLGRPGARYVGRGTATTNPDGAFAYAIPQGPTRRVQFSYANRTGGAAVAVATLHLSVRAPITFKLTKPHIAPRGLLQFSGRLTGGYIPTAGALVEIQALAGGKWRPVTNVRARAKGAFAGSYRFGTDRGRYKIRARVPTQSGYPFARGEAPVRVLTVG